MRSPRQTYYDLFSLIYDFIIRLHSRDTGGSLRKFIAHKANLSKGQAWTLCTEPVLWLSWLTGRKGITSDFSQGMLEKAGKKAKNSKIDQLHLVRANASQLPFKKSSLHAATCSHAFYELTGHERAEAVNEVARVLMDGSRFCLMEHAKPQRRISRLFFYVRILFLGARDVREFLEQEESIFGDRFKSIQKEISPTGQSK
jgi:SAM-dependent methyltransferase